MTPLAAFVIAAFLAANTIAWPVPQLGFVDPLAKLASGESGAGAAAAAVASNGATSGEQGGANAAAVAVADDKGDAIDGAKGGPGADADIEKGETGHPEGGAPGFPGIPGFPGFPPIPGFEKGGKCDITKIISDCSSASNFTQYLPLIASYWTKIFKVVTDLCASVGVKNCGLPGFPGILGSLPGGIPGGIPGGLPGTAAATAAAGVATSAIAAGPVNAVQSAATLATLGSAVLPLPK